MTIHEISTIEAATIETTSATATILHIAEHPDPNHGIAMVGVIQGLVDRASARAAELDALIDRIGEAEVGGTLATLKGVCGPTFVQAVIRAKAVLRRHVRAEDLFADWESKSIALFDTVQRLLLHAKP